MTQPVDRLPTSKRELTRLAEGTEFEDIAKDEAKLERLLFEAMKSSDDPMTREIGHGLAGGTMSWRTIATTSAYSDFLDRSLAALGQFDLGGLVDTLQTAQAEAARKEADERRQRDDDDHEDIWTGLGGKRR